MTLTEKLMARTADDAGCAVWQGSCSTFGRFPAVKIEGKVLQVRRLLAAETWGPLRNDQRVRMTCGTKACVSLECMKVMSNGDLAKELGALGFLASHSRSAAISKAKRASSRSKLTEADVVTIKTSDETAKALASRLNINVTTVGRIRRGVLRRDYSSPWAGLI